MQAGNVPAFLFSWPPLYVVAVAPTQGENASIFDIKLI